MDWVGLGRNVGGGLGRVGTRWVGGVGWRRDREGGIRRGEGRRGCFGRRRRRREER
jgi:hypothetical protein